MTIVARNAGREWSGQWSGFFDSGFLANQEVLDQKIRTTNRTKNIWTEKSGPTYLFRPVRIFGPVRATMKMTMLIQNTISAH